MNANFASSIRHQWANIIEQYLLSIAGCTIYKVKYVAALLYCIYTSSLPPYETGRTPTATLISLRSISEVNDTVPNITYVHLTTYTYDLRRVKNVGCNTPTHINIFVDIGKYKEKYVFKGLTSKRYLGKYLYGAQY